MTKSKSSEMKRVRLTHYDTHQQFYEINLGNGTKHQFANKKKAKKFLAVTNKFLTQNLVALSELYIEVFAIYRHSWFSMDKRGNYHENINILSGDIQSDIDAIGHCIERCIITYNNPKARNSFTFIWQRKAANYCKQIAIKIKQYEITKSIAINQYRYQKIIDTAILIEKQLATYGIETATEHNPSATMRQMSIADLELNITA